MIKNITPGPGIRIDHNCASIPYFNMNTPSAGMLRYNGGTQTFETYDGFNWTPVNSINPTIRLSDDVELTLTWAKKKMIEEQRLDELCKKYPGLGKARDSFETFRNIIEAEEASSEIQSN